MWSPCVPGFCWVDDCQRSSCGDGGLLVPARGPAFRWGDLASANANTSIPSSSGTGVLLYQKFWTSLRQPGSLPAPRALSPPPAVTSCSCARHPPHLRFRGFQWCCAPVLPACLAGWAPESCGTWAPALILPWARGQQRVHSLPVACSTLGNVLVVECADIPQARVSLPGQLPTCHPRSTTAILTLVGTGLTWVLL